MRDKKNSDSAVSKLDSDLFFQKKITTQTPSKQQKIADSEKTEIAKIPPTVEKTEIKDNKEIFPLKNEEENKSSENDELENDSTLAGVSFLPHENISPSNPPSILEHISSNPEDTKVKICHSCNEVITGAWCNAC